MIQEIEVFVFVSTINLTAVEENFQHAPRFEGCLECPTEETEARSLVIQAKARTTVARDRHINGINQAVVSADRKCLPNGQG